MSYSSAENWRLSAILILIYFASSSTGRIVKVSFLGDSITKSAMCYGADTLAAEATHVYKEPPGAYVDTGSYYQELKKLLPENSYALNNVGWNGRTMLKGDLYTDSYWTTSYGNPAIPGRLQTALQHCSTATFSTSIYPILDHVCVGGIFSDPDIIVINLGTNDAKDAFTKLNNLAEHVRLYTESYVTGINKLQEYFPSARIIALTPYGTFKNPSTGLWGDGTIRSDLYLDPNVGGFRSAAFDAVTRIKEAASSSTKGNFMYYDLWKDLRNSKTSIPYNYYDTCDGIHPNNNGYKKIAALVAPKVQYYGDIIIKTTPDFGLSGSVVDTIDSNGIVLSIALAISTLLVAAVAAVFYYNKRRGNHEQKAVPTTELGVEL